MMFLLGQAPDSNTRAEDKVGKAAAGKATLIPARRLPRIWRREVGTGLIFLSEEGGI
jgi:hypothetical protein